MAKGNELTDKIQNLFNLIEEEQKMLMSFMNKLYHDLYDL
jgi:hypothetical protein